MHRRRSEEAEPDHYREGCWLSLRQVAGLTMIATRLHHQLFVTIVLAQSLIVAATIVVWQLTGRKNDAQIALQSVDTPEARRVLSANADPVARRRFLAE